MMALMLTSCKSAWGIEFQRSLHDAGENWIQKLGENSPFLKKHLAELKLVCADIAELPPNACELVNQADAIFCNNLLFGACESKYRMYILHLLVHGVDDAWQKRDPYSFEYAVVPIAGKEYEARYRSP